MKASAALLFQKIQANHGLFWKRHPALLLSLTLMIGTSAPLFFDHYFWPVLWAAYLCACRYFSFLLLLCCAIAYGLGHQIADIPSQEVTGIFRPSSLQPHPSPFEKGLVLKGSFFALSQNLPCSIYIRDKAHSRWIANRDYVIKGALETRSPYDFILKPKEWEAIPSSWNLAQMRYQIKEGFKKILSENLGSKKATLFLHSITTGDVENRMLRYELGRLGLQHILAISGFHFAILIAFFSFLLSCVSYRMAKMAILFLCINAYFLFIGPSSAVERSYLTAMLYLLGKALHRPTAGLNLLGCAMGAEVLYNPLVSANIGFHLSFLSCFAILVFTPIIENKVRSILPRRSPTEFQKLTLLSQHGYLLSAFLRNSISLTLAVSFVLLPLLLYHFHQFPLLGLFYNLFFPFFVGICLSSLLLALLFHLLFPPIASCLYWITNLLTQSLLELTEYPPLAIEFSLRSAEISSSLVIGYLLILGLWKISLPEEREIISFIR